MHPKLLQPKEERTASGAPPGCPDLLITTPEVLEIPVSRSGVDLGICIFNNRPGVSPHFIKREVELFGKITKSRA